jgi:hypothetical protein
MKGLKPDLSLSHCRLAAVRHGMQETMPVAGPLPFQTAAGGWNRRKGLGRRERALTEALCIMRSGPTPRSYVPLTKLCKFYLRLLHPKAISEKAAEHFFFDVFTYF